MKVTSTVAAFWAGVEFGQFSLDTFQETQLESNQVVIDAHPMAGVFPMFRLDVLSFERALGCFSWWSCRYFHRYAEAVADLVTPVGVSLHYGLG